jgi:hypothetical protein
MAAKQKLKFATLPEHFDKDPLKPHALVSIQIAGEQPEGADEGDVEGQEAASPEEKKKPEEKKAKPKPEKGKKDVDTSKKSSSRVEKTNLDIEAEDKVLPVKTLAEDLFIYVVHEAATKELRADLCDFVKKQFAKDLENVELEAIKAKADAIGTKVEEVFFERFKDIPKFNF